MENVWITLIMCISAALLGKHFWKISGLNGTPGCTSCDSDCETPHEHNTGEQALPMVKD